MQEGSACGLAATASQGDERGTTIHGAWESLRLPPPASGRGWLGSVLQVLSLVLGTRSGAGLMVTVGARAGPVGSGTPAAVGMRNRVSNVLWFTELA